MPRHIVTSALPYVQSIIHLGNLTGSILPADIYYKFLKSSGEDAIFICGSDQHGTALELKAMQLKMQPEELANKGHEETKKLLELYGCTFTYYGKTHTEENKAVVYAIFRKLWENGYISKVMSEKPYCEIDKTFLSDRFIEGTCPICAFVGARGDQCDNCQNLLDPKDLVKPYCTICRKSRITFRETTNLAIDLPKFQERLGEFIRRSSANNWSTNAVNHSLGYIQRGLKAREITRDITWGFPVPLKGFEDKVLYVWLDAPIAYIGITDEWNAAQSERYWRARNTRLIQFMGKDNIEFHALLWPAYLMGSDLGYVLPHTIYAYEFLMWNGQKFSKSRGIGLDLKEAIGIMDSDYWRFVLASLLPETSDTDFSIDLLRQAVDNDMNNAIGNFVHRTLTMARNNLGAKVPELVEKDLGTEELAVLEEAQREISNYKSHFGKIEIREALRCMVSVATIGNAYMSKVEPWKLVKSSNGDDNERFRRVMYVTLNIAYDLAILLYPFTPAASARLLKVFSEPEARMALLPGHLRGGAPLDLGGLKPLFSKLSKEQIKAIEDSIKG